MNKIKRMYKLRREDRARRRAEAHKKNVSDEDLERIRQAMAELTAGLLQKNQELIREAQNL